MIGQWGIRWVMDDGTSGERNCGNLPGRYDTKDLARERVRSLKEDEKDRGVMYFVENMETHRLAPPECQVVHTGVGALPMVIAAVVGFAGILYMIIIYRMSQ